MSTKQSRKAVLVTLVLGAVGIITHIVGWKGILPMMGWNGLLG